MEPYCKVWPKSNHKTFYSTEVQTDPQSAAYNEYAWKHSSKRTFGFVKFSILNKDLNDFTKYSTNNISKVHYIFCKTLWKYYWHSQSDAGPLKEWDVNMCRSIDPYLEVKNKHCAWLTLHLNTSILIDLQPRKVN